jgi:hypothetical protein
MLSPELLESFNDRLNQKFGKLFDKPKYVLAWSSSCYENRYVEGFEYLKGTTIKLRDIKGIRSMPKYPRNKDRYVLQMLMEVPEGLKHELPGENGLTYEPLFFFEKGGVYAEPNWNLINALACVSHFPVVEVMSPEFEIWKMDKAEYDDFMTILNDTIPDLCAAMKSGSAAFIDSTKTFGSEKKIQNGGFYLIGDK